MCSQSSTTWPSPDREWMPNWRSCVKCPRAPTTLRTSTPTMSHRPQVIDRYRDHGIGIADASIVVLAERSQVNRILTLDQRRFRAMTDAGGHPFELVPLD